MTKAYLQIHGAVLLFGFSGLFGKWVTAAPSVIVEGRTLVAGVALYLLLKLLKKSVRWPEKNVLGSVFLSGIVLALHWMTFFHAIQISSVAVGLIGFTTYPIFVTLIEPFVQRQRLRRVDLACLGFVVIGLLILTPSFSLENNTTKGLLWAVASGGLNAIFTLLNRRLVQTIPSLDLVVYQQAIVAFVVLPFALAKYESVQGDALWYLVLLGLFFTAIPQSLYISSLTKLKAQLVSIVTCLEPVYSILLAALLLGEIPRANIVLGSIVVLFAVVISLKSHMKTTVIGI